MIRLILAWMGELSEDRITAEDWSMRENVFTLPSLHLRDEDEELFGTGPICRFLADKAGLAGSSKVERAEVILCVLVEVVE